jgi:polyphenol oxidase
LPFFDQSEIVPGFADLGIRAFTTTRASGTFGVNGPEPVHEVMSRWYALKRELGGSRFATSSQVHGATVIEHHGGWSGWLRVDDADGHAVTEPGTAIAVSVADCVPVFIAAPGGAIALLHSGWRGTAARIVERGIEALMKRGYAPAGMRVHSGPAICGKCYEVSAEVYEQLTGKNPGKPTPIDLRALIADHARAMGVREITTSASCTRCDNDRFFSHRAGDSGRQLGVMQVSS